MTFPAKQRDCLSFIGSLKPTVLCEHGLPSPIIQGGFFPANVFDKLVVNMTSCFEAEEELDKEDGRQENSLGKIDKTLVALDAIPVHLNWGKSLVYTMRHVSIWSQP